MKVASYACGAHSFPYVVIHVTYSFNTKEGKIFQILFRYCFFRSRKLQLAYQFVFLIMDIVSQTCEKVILFIIR